MTSAARISIGSLASEVWKAAAVPWKLAWMLAGKPISCSACWIAFDGLAQRDARRQVERQRHHRELALVIDRQRRIGASRSA